MCSLVDALVAPGHAMSGTWVWHATSGTWVWYAMSGVKDMGVELGRGIRTREWGWPVSWSSVVFNPAFGR